jgi:hypothetical protein
VLEASSEDEHPEIAIVTKTAAKTIRRWVMGRGLIREDPGKNRPDQGGATAQFRQSWRRRS